MTEKVLTNVELEEFWNKQAQNPGYTGVVSDDESGMSTRMLYNYLSTKFSFRNEIVLDAGCGVGRLFPVFLEGGASEITGVDFSIDMLRMARFKYPHPNIILYRLALSKLKMFDNDTFSTIVCCGVFCHIVNDTELTASIEELVRTLKPNGVLLHIDQTSTALDTFYEHSNMRMRPINVYKSMISQHGLDVLCSNDVILGVADHIDSLKTVTVYVKKG